MRKCFIIYIIFFSCMLLVHQDGSFGGEKLSKKLGLRIKTIYLDPWYGGKENGPRFSQEKHGKDVTLEIAQKIKGLLESEGFNVYLSRSGDKLIALEERVAQARLKGADIHLIIKVTESKKDCISIYIVPRPITTRRTTNAKNTEERSNDLNEILEALAADNKYDESLTLAGTISKKLYEEDFFDCIQLLRRFDYVLLNAPMPAVLVDFGFSIATKKCPYILDTTFQDKVSQSLADVIRGYADDRAPKMNQ